ncbi:hypothetical protein [Xenorhabdus bharatensis]|uniref:hypothetical protein n=1 Tax=Xenorhabdus bharatensis TaxID=3136256 RepID=UPI0030F439EE
MVQLQSVIQNLNILIDYFNHKEESAMIEVILEDAIKYARKIYRGKTSNKIYRDVSKLLKHKQAMHTPEAIVKRVDKHKQFLKKINNINLIRDIHQYSLSRFNSGEELVGNCGELSISAFVYLSEQKTQEILNYFNDKRNSDNKSLPIYVLCISLSYPYDHSFVAVTLPENSSNLPKLDNIYEISFNNSWICDPWAKIACPYSEYVTRWKVKMLKWHLVEKGVSIYLEDQDVHCPSPLRQHNYHAITESSKRVASMAVVKCDGSMMIFQDA